MTRSDYRPAQRHRRRLHTCRVGNAARKTKEGSHLNRQRSRWLAIALVGIGVSAVPVVGNAESPQSAGGGGEIIDGGTFPVGPPDHIDPALNMELNSFQFINAMFDGLTEIDDSDPENIAIVPHLAESFEPNEDATVWTFVVKEGQQFSDGEPILPSTFKRSWERAALLPGNYSYLMNFIEGGEAAVDGEAEEISGIVADDEAMTLTVTLSAPYANFPALAGFQTFMPTPEAAVEAGEDWENQLMVGNGPYAMESPRNDQEIVLVRNDDWLGDADGETWPDRAERIVFQINADTDTSYNALEAGETDIARIPGARAEEARSNWGTTLDVSVLGSYYYRSTSAIPASVARRTSCSARRSRWRSTARRSTRPSTTAPARSRRASRLQASPGSRRTSASTARTTPRAQRRPTRSGRRRATRSTSRYR